MKMPSKIISFKESIFFKALKILEKIEYLNFDVDIKQLFLLMKQEMSILEFMDAITILKLLKKIDIEGEKITYASRNKL